MDQERTPAAADPLGPVSAVATARILAGIRAGTWPGGEALPPERVLAATLGIARNTLRQALRHLEAEGWLVRQVGRGTFVRHRGTPPAGIAAGAMAGAAAEPVPPLSEASPAELMEVRLIIEPQGAALAANRASATDLERIAQALDASIAAGSVDEFERWDAELHLAILCATKNSVLADYGRAVNAVRNTAAWYQLKNRTLTPALRALYHRQHGEIVAALTRRDPQAVRLATQQHLTTVRANLLGDG